MRQLNVKERESTTATPLSAFFKREKGKKRARDAAQSKAATLKRSTQIWTVPLKQNFMHVPNATHDRYSETACL